MEEHLRELGLSEDAKDYARAIFRFSNLPVLEICQYAMEAKQGGEWFFKHPFDHLHGLDESVVNP